MAARLSLLSCLLLSGVAHAQPGPTQTTVDDSAVRDRAEQKLERAWRGLGYTVRDRSMSTRTRLTAVIDFIERFGPTNPHASNAERYKEALEIGHEPVFRTSEAEACVDPTLPGDERVDASPKAHARRQDKIERLGKETRRAPPPGLLHLELQLAELHRRAALAASDEPRRSAAQAAAWALLQDILQNHPDYERNDEVRYLLLLDALAEDRTKDAEKHLEALLARHRRSPRLPYASFAFGRHAARHGDWETARTHLARARGAPNEDLAHVAVFWHAIAADALGDESEALMALRRLAADLGRDPKDNARLIEEVDKQRAAWRGRRAEPAPRAHDGG